MKLRKFISEINSLAPTRDELAKVGANPSISGKWAINIIDDEFQAYSDPMYRLVYCCDYFELFPNFVQLNSVKDLPKYSVFGENPDNGFQYALDIEDRIVLLDDVNDFSENVATDPYSFLDALFETAKLEKRKVLCRPESDEIQNSLDKCVELSGGKLIDNSGSRIWAFNSRKADN